MKDKGLDKNIYPTRESLFETLILESPMAVGLFVGPNMVIEMANKSILSAWGRDEDVIGKPLEQALPELEGQPFLEILRNVYLTGDNYYDKEAEVRLMVNNDLQTFYFNLSYHALKDEYGSVWAIMNTALDVTEQVLAKKRLTESERNFRKMILQSPVAMCVFRGSNFVVEVANDRMFELWGKTRQESQDKPIFTLLPELIKEGFEQILIKVFTTGETFTANELAVPLRRGGKMETVYVNFSYEPLWEDDKIQAILAVAIDVTQLVVARKRSEESEKALLQTIEVANLGTFELSDTGIVKMSPRIIDWLGLDKDEGGYQLNEILSSFTEQSKMLVAIRAAFDFGEGGVLDIEYCAINRKTNAKGYFRTRGLVFTDEEKNELFIRGATMNVTEQKRLYQQKDEFISVASHELKTPLTSLRAGFQILDRQLHKELNVSDKLLKISNTTKVNVKKLSDLVDELLNFSKIEKGQLRLNKTVFTISKVIDECCDHIRLPGKHELVTTGDLDLQVYADRQKIDRVIVNLVNNAVKYAPESNKIILRIESQPKIVKVSVQDFGMGIEEEKLQDIFNRFYQVDNTGNQFSGLGLGLYISSEIIKQHNGEIGVESEPGKGSTFWFTIPKSDDGIDGNSN